MDDSLEKNKPKLVRKKTTKGTMLVKNARSDSEIK
jgi:hypothetical protein